MKRVLFPLLAICLPFVVLVALEGLLRLADVAEHERAPFRTLPSNEAYEALNPEFVGRYFQGFRSSVAYNPFRVRKPRSGFRVFVLGGSSTAGFPYHFYTAFPARLQTRLTAHAVGQPVEVVNLGLTAVNSFTLWDLKDDLVERQPDAVVIYAGHNEYYGAYGVGSSINAFSDRIWLKRLILRLKRSVLYTLVERLVRDEPPPLSRDRTLMARAVRDATIELDGPVYIAGIRQFETNMTDLVETFRAAGVPVYIGTLTSNLKDQPPLGDNPEAVTAYEAERFMEAKEYDDIRFRAPEALNTVIRTLGEQEGVTIVELPPVAQAGSTSGIEDDGFFTDHLHPNAEGLDAIAGAFFDALASHPNLRPNPLARIEAPYRIDPYEAAFAELQIAQLKAGYPFRKDRTVEEELSEVRRLAIRYRQSDEYADSLAALTVVTGQTGPPLLQAGLRLARAERDTLSALLFYRSLIDWQPFNIDLMQQAIAYALEAPAYDALVEELALTAANRSDDVYPLNALALIKLRRRNLDDASLLLNLAESREPFSSTMLYNKARLLVLQGDTVGARTYFDRYQASQ